MNRFLFLFFCVSSSIFSEPILNGILLSGKTDEINPIEFQSVEIAKDLEIPGNVKVLQNQLISKFFGKPISKELILEIKNHISDYYAANDRPIIAVRIPEQDISCGCLRLILLEGRVGTVSVSGNCHFNSDVFLNGVGVCEGDCIDAQALRNDLLWLNRNPFRRVDVVYAPGKNKCTTDIQLLVHDMKTWRIYSGVDNSGNSITLNNRFFTGFNVGNLFWAGHRDIIESCG